FTLAWGAFLMPDAGVICLFFIVHDGGVVYMAQNGRIDMLYDLIQKMRIETNKRFDRLEARLEKQFYNHDQRINALEEKHAHLEGKVKAWAAMISAGVSAAVKWLLPGQGGKS